MFRRLFEIFLAPIILALAYRIPWSFFHPAPPEGGVKLMQLFQVGRGAVVFALIEVAVTIWYLVVASATLGEAHRFSNWRGFATLMIVLSIPFILALAFVLTSVT